MWISIGRAKDFEDVSHCLQVFIHSIHEFVDLLSLISVFHFSVCRHQSTLNGRCRIKLRSKQHSCYEYALALNSLASIITMPC